MLSASDYQSVPKTASTPGGDSVGGGASSSRAGAGTGLLGDNGGDTLPSDRRRHAAAWQCGPLRLKLRTSFNTKEIDAARIIKRYDRDQSGVLEESELGPLLKDYNSGQPVTDDEQHYIMAVADRNGDGVISKDEVLEGLRSWFALHNLPKSAERALEKWYESLGGSGGACALPEDKAFQEVLRELNEGQPVGLEEAQWVRDTVLAVGATDSQVTLQQLQRAVAHWYLHIEREETSSEELARKAAETIHGKAMAMLHGKFDKRSRAVRSVVCLFVSLGVIMPAIEIMVSQHFPASYTCEYPHLGYGLYWKGTLTLLLSACVTVPFVQHALRVGGMLPEGVTLEGTGWSIVPIVIGCVDIIILGVLEVFGVLQTSSSTSSRCGFSLWSFCWIVYCFIPFCLLIFAGVGLPIVLASEYMRMRHVEEDLMAISVRHNNLPKGAVAMRSKYAGQVTRPKDALQWQCGAERVAVRQKFNVKEIDAAKLVQKYDADGNGVLDLAEVHELLEDYNDGKRISPEDLEYIMNIADMNRDGVISQDEVLLALRVWYAFRYLPKSTGPIFTAFSVGDAPLLSEEKMQAFLTALNGSHEVSDAEVAYVRNLAFTLGAEAEWASILQMRQAIAAWYLNIERQETGKMQLARQSISSIGQKVRHIQAKGEKFARGEVDYTSVTTLVVFGVAIFVTVALPIFEVLIAQAFPTNYTCEHPQMAAALQWTGIVTLLVVTSCIGMFGIAAIKTEGEKIGKCKIALRGLVIALVMVMLSMEAFGIYNTTSSSSARCGLVLWSFSHFTYIMAPSLALIFACCGAPCLFCSEYYENEAVDGSLDAELGK